MLAIFIFEIETVLKVSETYSINDVALQLLPLVAFKSVYWKPLIFKNKVPICEIHKKSRNLSHNTPEAGEM